MDTQESSIISCLNSSDLLSSTVPGKEVVPSLVDEFWVSGPNGKHICTVTSPAMMSLSEAKEVSNIGGLFNPRLRDGLSPGFSRGFSQSVVHGDLHLGNYLFPFPRPIENLSVLALYENFRELESEAVVRTDGKPLSRGVPATVFLPGWIGVCSENIEIGGNIIISDFGKSFMPHEAPRYSSKAPLLQPPEARFPNKPLSFASDVWTLACSIWEVYGQRPLFETFSPSSDHVTAEQVEVLGNYWSVQDARRDLDNIFEFSIQEPHAQAGLEKVIEDEIKAFKAMLRSMLYFQLEDRATAEQIAVGLDEGLALPVLHSVK